jgi:hypothetical protein
LTVGASWATSASFAIDNQNYPGGPGGMRMDYALIQAFLIFAGQILAEGSPTGARHCAARFHEHTISSRGNKGWVGARLPSISASEFHFV